ncbi:MAG: hypothetical protein ABFQ65_02520 [Nanoarchaeota archaeon]
MQNKKAQIWVETVIYTLIAFVLIGTVLAFVRPKIEEFQDKVIIEQTLTAFEDINTMILSIVQGGAGNKRIIEMGLKKGILKIEGTTDKLVFEIESRYAYGEDKQNITVGNIITLTENKGKLNLVTLTLDYSERYDITYQNESMLKLINKAATPYKIAISNNGKENTKTKIDFKVI